MRYRIEPTKVSRNGPMGSIIRDTLAWPVHPLRSPPENLPIEKSKKNRQSEGRSNAIAIILIIHPIKDKEIL